MEKGFIEVGVVDWKTAEGMTHDTDGAITAGPSRGVPRLFMGAQDESIVDNDDEMEV